MIKLNYLKADEVKDLMLYYKRTTTQRPPTGGGSTKVAKTAAGISGISKHNVSADPIHGRTVTSKMSTTGRGDVKRKRTEKKIKEGEQSRERIQSREARHKRGA